MKKFAFLLSVVLLGFTALAGAMDSDPDSSVGHEKDPLPVTSTNRPVGRRIYGVGQRIGYRVAAVRSRFGASQVHTAKAVTPDEKANPPLGRNVPLEAPRSAVSSIVHDGTTSRPVTVSGTPGAGEPAAPISVPAEAPKP